MRQVRDTLVWLAMILVVGGVIYVMPQVSRPMSTPQRGASMGPHA